MKKPRPDSRVSGFTLVEILVVVAILIVLAALVVAGAQRAVERARIAANVNNMRNLGPTLTAYAQSHGGYPPGWSFTKGESWARVVLRESTGRNKGQDRSLLSPLVARDIPSNLDGLTITNYSANPIIFPQESRDPRSGEELRPYPLTPAMLKRPGEQILLGDGLPSGEDSPYGFTMTVMWALRGTPSGNDWASPPVSDESKSEKSVSLPMDIVELTHDSRRGLPAFRNRGKGHFLFADGHVEALEPKELKYKHFAISY